MSNIEQYKEPHPIEVHFPLSSRDVIRILKGVEYNQEQILRDGTRLRVTVYSSDRVKHISWDNWRHLVAAASKDPELMRIIQFIENENDAELNPL